MMGWLRVIVLALGLVVTVSPATAWSEQGSDEAAQQTPAADKATTADQQAESERAAAAGGPTWPVPKF